MLLVNVAGTVSGWSLTSGPGTVTPNTGNETIALAAAGGTPTVTRRVYTVVSGKNYRFRWTTSGNTCGLKLGNTAGGTEYKGLSTQDEPLGANTFTFLTSSTSLYVEFQRTTAGTSTIGGLSLEQLD